MARRQTAVASAGARDQRGTGQGIAELRAEIPPSRRSERRWRNAAAAAAGRIRVGIAGWVFPPWRGSFYPKGLKQKDELAHASRAFTTLEVNGTFYAMQRPETFAAWDEETPGDFVFSLKGPRFITHMKRLKDCAAPLANFLASGVLRLGAKFGPILWQLPPNMAFDATPGGPP